MIMKDIAEYEDTDSQLSKDTILRLHNEIEKLNKGIIGLNNCIIEFHSEFCNKQAEINRLNNIINELEDLIVIKLQRDYHEHNYRINTGDLEEIYDKLQELKGVDK